MPAESPRRRRVGPSLSPFLAFGILLIVLAGQVARADEIIGVNTTATRHTVSPLVFGHHLVYAHEQDRLYADGALPGLLSDMGAEFLRWPGGTVTTFYHWNDLTGNGWQDTWNPDYDRSADKPPSAFMDVDEYIALLRQTGAAAMIGINLSSAAEWRTVDAGIEEARALLSHFSQRDIPIAYVYLDNETYHPGNQHNMDPRGDGGEWTGEKYAAHINRYAEVIKQIAPAAKIIANWDNRFRGRGKRLGQLKQLVRLAGPNIDYIDTHWKWGRRWASWTRWKERTPIEFDYMNKFGIFTYDAGTLGDENRSFKQLMARLGHPHIGLAILEWNIAPGPWQRDPTHTPHKTALMQAEILMQLIDGDIEIAAFYTLHSPFKKGRNNRFVLDAAGDYRVNPTADVFKLLQHAKNRKLLTVDGVPEDLVALVTEGSRPSQRYLFLLNKQDLARKLVIRPTGPAAGPGYRITRSKTLTVTGRLEDDATPTDDGRFVAPPNSLTFVVLESG